MFHNFFQYSGKVQELVSLFVFFEIPYVARLDVEVHYSSDFSFLHNSQQITFPAQLCLLLYFFGTSL